MLSHAVVAAAAWGVLAMSSTAVVWDAGSRWQRRLFVLASAVGWVALAVATAVLLALLLGPRGGAPTPTRSAPTLVILGVAAIGLIVAANLPNALARARSVASLTSVGAASLAILGGASPLPFVPCLVVVSLAVAVVAAAELSIERPSWARRGGWLAVGAAVAVVGASIALGPPTLPYELAGTPRHPFAIPADPAPHTMTEVVQSGILTTTLGPDQRSIALALHGTFEASTPNFHQVVRVSLVLASRRGGYLVVHAAGVPQPNGSLELVHSYLRLALRQGFLSGSGYLQAFAPDALLGTLRLAGRRWSVLISLEPTGNGVVDATAVLWPRTPATTLHLS